MLLLYTHFGLSKFIELAPNRLNFDRSQANCDCLDDGWNRGMIFFYFKFFGVVSRSCFSNRTDFIDQLTLLTNFLFSLTDITDRHYQLILSIAIWWRIKKLTE